MRTLAGQSVNTFYVIMCVFVGTIASCNYGSGPRNDYKGWPAYAGSIDGIRYSANDEININNVSELKVAWTYSSQDKDTGNRSQIQCNPIIINKTLYGV